MRGSTVSHYNKLWVVYFECAPRYLQYYMLVAIVYVRNNGKCHF